MVKMVKLCLTIGLLIVFAAPAFAQDFPKLVVAPGYGNFNLKGISGRHSGFTLGTDYNFKPNLGADLFTGYYSLGSNTTLYTNTFGLTTTLRKNEHILPFGTAGFGFGSLTQSTSLGIAQGKAMATRVGGGFDIPFHDSMAFRFDATRMGFHFGKKWESGMNYSVGIALNLTQ